MPPLPPLPPIDIPEFKVLARLGYARGKTVVDPATEELVRGEIRTARMLVAARQVISSSSVTLTGEGVLLHPDFTIRSNDIRKLLEGCTAAWGFAVTIGPSLEKKRAMYLENGETARALVLDAAGSVAAEEYAELTHRMIAAEAAPMGMKATRRFSPGYGDWPLAQQADLLRWLGAEAIGIRLTDHFQMMPEKSVSAILGMSTIDR